MSGLSQEDRRTGGGVWGDKEQITGGGVWGDKEDRRTGGGAWGNKEQMTVTREDLCIRCRLVIKDKQYL